MTDNPPAFKAINLRNNNLMMIIWDLGPRCNFDCSYCTSYMHDNHSKHSPFEELKKTADFIADYYKRYQKIHKHKIKPRISYTGGEPVINPDFWKLVKYVEDTYGHFLTQSLTTNGTWPHKFHEQIGKYFKGITISYHVEGPEHLKERARKNILMLKDSNINHNVNVMMHVDHWDECIDLIDNLLIPNGIKYIPRVIGDNSKAYDQGIKWFKDDDGSMRRITHPYDDEQLQWFRDYWANKNRQAQDEQW